MDLNFLDPRSRVSLLGYDRPPVFIYEDAKRTAAELASVSRADSENYPEFISTFARIGRAIRPLLELTPPDIDAPSQKRVVAPGQARLGSPRSG